MSPFEAAVMRVATQHYGGRPPQAWLARIAPTLQSTPNGRRLLSSFSLGDPSQAPAYRAATASTPYLAP
jgi:hypothetical protein